MESFQELQTDLCHLFTVGFWVERRFCEQNGVLLRSNTKLVVERVMPDLLIQSSFLLENQTFKNTILDHFQAIYEIELNSHTKSCKSHPKLAPPVDYHFLTESAFSTSMSFFMLKWSYKPISLDFFYSFTLDGKFTLNFPSENPSHLHSFSYLVVVAKKALLLSLALLEDNLLSLAFSLVLSNRTPNWISCLARTVSWFFGFLAFSYTVRSCFLCGCLAIPKSEAVLHWTQ